MKKLLLSLALICGIGSFSHATFVPAIISTSSLQTGATVYVASGTINNLTVSTITMGGVYVGTSVVVQYAGTPSGSIGAADNWVTYGTKGIDTHNAYVSSTFTVPTNGYYYISAAVDISGTPSAGGSNQLKIFKNGVSIAIGLYRSQSTTVTNYQSQVSTVVSLIAGDKIAIVTNCDFSGPSFVASNFSYLNIFRLF